MSKRWKTIASFAGFGLIIAVLLYVQALFHDFNKPMNPRDLTFGIASFFFCPPSLLYVMCIDCEVGGSSGLVMYSIIGILNAALYGAIGMVFVSLRKKSN
jgi:hypothetical protein